MRFHIISLFPEALSSYLASSIIGRARREGKLRVSFYNPRDYTKDKHRRVDRRPYGGGPGMVLEAPAVLAAASRALKGKRGAEVIVFSPSGKPFTSAYARTLARKKDVLLIAGHYEGLDARVKSALKAKEISIGPYVLTGGELPALVLIDAVARHLKGVLGNRASLEEERLRSPEVYTRPEALRFRGKTYRVPAVLRSGHHGRIEAWRRRGRRGKGLSTRAA